MNTITMKQAENILSVLRRIEPKAEMRTDYSGRGMYGQTCLGFVVSNPEIVGAGIAIGLADSDIDAVELMSHASRDAMGRDFIVYFPDATVTGQ